MRFVVLDFETYFDKDYTLRKLSTESYIRDPRFIAHGAAIKWSKDHAAKWYDEPHLRHILKQEDWSDVFLICHHAQFDGLVLSHHYGINPKMWGCTLSMARLLLGNHLSVSLDSVRKQYGMAPKSTPYGLFQGKHWREIPPEHRGLIAEGACDEVESIWKLFGLLSKDFPAEEFCVVDTLIKMFTQPVLRGDVPLLGQIWQDEHRKKCTLFETLGITEADVQSSERFAELLREQGVEPELKDSPSGKGQIYAFAKTDEFMRGLEQDENETVQQLAAARLGAKGTILQTRAETFGYMAGRGPLCVYLSYSGAGTLRPSGGDKSNFLNLKRGSPLRRALLAPEGFLLAPIDSSQIECRVLHYLAGGPDEPVLVDFRDGKDAYAALASKIYGEKIYKPAKDDPRRAEMEAKRGTGKQSLLMAGYGCGAAKYRATAKNGLYGPSVDLTMEEAERHVSIYRDNTPSVCGVNGYWEQASIALAELANGKESKQWGPLWISNHRLYLPNGCPLIYDTLEWFVPSPQDFNEGRTRSGWRMQTKRGGHKFLWGSKLVQNICEAVARVIISQAMNRITSMGYRVLNWPYDELLILIPKDGKEQFHVERCEAEMKREVPWLPGLPLDCESHLGERYSK